MSDTSSQDNAGSHGLAPEFLEMLVCPLGKADLQPDGDTLVCTRCGPVFRIEDGIPILLIEEAKLPDSAKSVDDLPCCKDASPAANESAGSDAASTDD
jgi:uncharacterized protein YbaR (Trm112 family)